MHRTNRGMKNRNSRLCPAGDPVVKSGLQFEAAQETGKHAAQAEMEKKRAIRRFWQKQRYKKAYQAAQKGEQTAAETVRITQTVFAKVKLGGSGDSPEGIKEFLGALAAMVLLLC